VLDRCLLVSWKCVWVGGGGGGGGGGVVQRSCGDVEFLQVAWQGADNGCHHAEGQMCTLGRQRHARESASTSSPPNPPPHTHAPHHQIRVALEGMHKCQKRITTDSSENIGCAYSGAPRGPVLKS
jgi:hypothetical protein